MTYLPSADEMQAEDALPLVANRKQSNLGVWIFASVCLIGGWLLFSALSEGRQQADVSGLQPRATVGNTVIASPPPLQLPTDFVAAVPAEPRPVLLRQLPQTRPQVSAAPTVRQPPAQPSRPSPAVPYSYTTSPAQPRPADPGPRVVYDASRDARPVGSVDGGREMVEEGRIKATRFTNPAFTVPRGTVIPAVLETAIDSTRPGAVRALVQRDIKGFDGSRVLIHRGSRLYGEYSGDIAQGQKRALVKWTRLIRPDGVVINLDSPASDPLGRAGIEGDVDSHFWSRLGNALLGTAVNLGGTLATGAIGGGGVVVMPNGQQVAPTQSQDLKPTLRVDHGTSVSVFVAQDLDFSDVDS